MSNTPDPREASLAKPRPPQGPSDAEVLEAFHYHRPSPEQQDRIEALRRSFRDTAAEVLNLCPPSADRSAAIRELRVAAMTAIASIALEPGTERHPL